MDLHLGGSCAEYLEVAYYSHGGKLGAESVASVSS